jgi:ligand-binding SRPBCC domain-containing protein
VIEIERSSRLLASCEDVWRVVSTMDGVNAELRPFLRMTYPPTRAALDVQVVHEGEVVFASWLLAFGLVPFDRHSLGLASVDPGRGFVEESTSWLQRRWRHERTLEADDIGGCVVTDRLTVQPRVGLVAPVVARIVGALFTHRHRRLRARFGER